MSKEYCNEEQLIASLDTALEDFKRPVKITDGYEFNFEDTINKIELYRASKFKTGDRDAQGNKKYFFNIINPQCGNATKFIDLNRRDIRVRATDHNDYVKAMLYNVELKYWMRKMNTGLLLNKISENLPIYGSCVLRKVGSEVKFIPLRKLKFDPAVSNKENNYDVQSPYVIEEINFQPDELEAMIQNGWWEEEVMDITNKFRENRIGINSADILVYEYHGEFKNEDLGLQKPGWSKACVYIGTISYRDRITGKYLTEKEVLYIKPVKKFPYKKIDYMTIEGRALGLGITEMLFDAQQRWNEMANQKALSMRISSKHIFQTRDNLIEKNLLNDMMDGDILKVSSEVTPVATEERNLASYRMEEDNVMNIVRSNANAFETLTGEALPSGTPYRLGVMLGQSGGKLFEFIRQNIGMFLEELFKEWVVPEAEKEMTRKHVFELTDKDTVQLLFERDVNKRVNDAIKKLVIAQGIFPSDDDIEIIKQSAMREQKDVEFVDIKEGYLNFDKELEIDITGEQTNTAAKVETINNLLQLLAQNPQIVELPQTKGLFSDLLELVGVGAGKIKSAEAQPALNQLTGPAAAGMMGNVPLAAGQPMMQ